MATSEVTRLLSDWRAGNSEALVRLTDVLYQELRRMAAVQMRSEAGSRTLQPTALVHELYLRLVAQTPQAGEGKAEFFGIAARIMRQILVDHARARQAAKRGGDLQRVDAFEAISLPEVNPDILSIDAALKALDALDSRKARVVELKFFAGLTIAETAQHLGVSPATVERDWEMARAWLQRYMRSNPDA